MPHFHNKKLTHQQWNISHKALRDAIKIIGSQGKLAKLLGIKRQSITAFISGKANLPIVRAIQIEELTYGKVKKSQLRPDVF